MRRRAFLELVGMAGGATATLSAMEALGLAAQPPAPGRFALDGPRGSASVAIIGGGVAGLTVAYELGKAGYQCTVLEARPRVGGRVFTIRGGTSEVDADGHRQTAGFAEGLFYNAGAMRIPPGHTLTIDYCRELGVAVEPFIDSNEHAYLYTENAGPLSGKRVRMREARADLNGYIGELLAKAVDKHALDVDLTPADRERIVEYLKRDVMLDTRGKYVATTKRGYAVPPGAGTQSGRLDDPMALRDLLAANYGPLYGSDTPMQRSMLQITGGTDRLTEALAAKLGSRVQTGCIVKSVKQDAQGVRVAYTDAQGQPAELRAQYGVLAVPLTVLATMDVDLSPRMAEAVKAIPYAAAGKIGLQFKRRFWEEDDEIFGGISKTNLEISQIVYPSQAFLSARGILIGYYQMGDVARAMAARPPEERLRIALEQGARIHPQYTDSFDNASYSVAWHRTPHSLGGWAQYSPALRRTYFDTLNAPDGALYLAGEHVSWVTAWIVGALASARLVATKLHERASRQ
jgi:monoamine oxidase